MKYRYLKKIRNIELFAFCLLLVSLPALEAPKNIGLGLFILASLVIKVYESPDYFKNLIKKPDPVEIVLIFMWLIALISTLLNYPMEKGLKGLAEYSILFVLMWSVYRNKWSRKTIIFSVLSIIVGIYIALAWGWWDVFYKNAALLEFHAMKRVYNSAIYLAIGIVCLIGCLLDENFTLDKKLLFFLIFIVSLLAFLPCLLVMGVRSATLGFIVTLIVMLISLLRFKKFRLALICFFVYTAVVVVMIMNFSPFSIKNRFNHLLSTEFSVCMKDLTENDKFRLDLWKIAYIQATQGGKALFGIGPYNGRATNIENLNFDKPLNAITKRVLNVHPFDPHNIFLKKWVEEGFIGLFAFIAFLSAIYYSLIKYRPGGDIIHWYWVACLGAITIPVVAGLYNPVFHEENNILTMIIAGLALNQFEAGNTAPSA